MENNIKISYELYNVLYSNDTKEELRKRFKEIIAAARDLEAEVEISLEDVVRGMEICRQLKDLDEEDHEPVALMQYPNEMENEGMYCQEDLQLEDPSSVDISGHIHLLVDVAMEERDYHDVLVVRRYLETFNRKDNHLVEAELPRLDAYIATLDGYYEYLEQRNRKPLDNGIRIGRKKNTFCV